MNNNVFGTFVMKQVAAAILGAISTVVVIGAAVALQHNFGGGVMNAALWLLLGWGISWTWWFSAINFFMDNN